jgi:hypothetical protein
MMSREEAAQCLRSLASNDTFSRDFREAMRVGADAIEVSNTSTESKIHRQDSGELRRHEGLSLEARQRALSITLSGMTNTITQPIRPK